MGIVSLAGFLAVHAAALIACSDRVEFWATPRILVFSDGSIGVLANRHFSVHGGSGRGHESRCVRSPVGAWSCARLDTLPRIGWQAHAPPWRRTTTDREYLVFDGLEGGEIWTSVDGLAWTEVAPPRATDSRRDPAGSAWVTGDDALHVLVGDEEWVVRGDTVEQTHAWPVRCASSVGQLCTYDPRDDLSGHVVKYYITPENEPALELSELACDGASCDVTSRVGPIWYTRHPEGRLLHRADGTPAYVNRGPSFGLHSPIQVSSNVSSIALTPDDVYFYDAVALPDGRIAVALATYSRSLWLVLVDAEGAASSVELATGDSQGVAVALAPRASGPEHVLVVNVDSAGGRLFEVTTGLDVVLSEAIPLTP